MKPSSESPQPKPNASYIGRPASGIKAPTMERQMVFAARAEAACSANAWTRSFAKRQKSCPTSAAPSHLWEEFDSLTKFGPEEWFFRHTTTNPAKYESEYLD